MPLQPKVGSIGTCCTSSFSTNGKIWITNLTAELESVVSTINLIQRTAKTLLKISLNEPDHAGLAPGVI